MTQPIVSTLNIMGANYPSQQPINITILEKHYGAKYVGDFCLKTKEEGWSEIPVAIFYQPNPQTDLGHTHYFGLFVMPNAGKDVLMITSGDSAFADGITGIIADNGEVIFSRYRHDYHTSQDQSVSIDGGRDYCKIRGNPDRLVDLIIDKDQLVIAPGSIKIQEHLLTKKRTTLSTD